MYMCMQVPVYLCVGMCMGKPEKGLRSPGAGSISSYVLLKPGVRNLIQVSMELVHMSSQMISFTNEKRN